MTNAETDVGHTILVFLYRMAWQYFDGNPVNGGDECRWGRLKFLLSTNVWLYDQ